MNDDVPRLSGAARRARAGAALAVTATVLLLALAWLATPPPHPAGPAAESAPPAPLGSSTSLGPPTLAAPREDVIRHTLDAAHADGRGHVDIQVGPHDVSLLLTLAFADPDHAVGITRITDPAGRLVHASPFATDSWDTVSFASDIVAEAPYGDGDLALFVTDSARLPLIAGTWRVAFETDPPDAAPVRVEHIAKIDASAEDPADDYDALPQSIDLHLHALHPMRAYRGERLRASVENRWRAALDRVLAPHALSVGTVTVTDAPPPAAHRLARLDDEAEIAEACRAARAAYAAPAVGADALHIGLVRDITDAQGEDWTTGLSPQPGLPYDGRSPNACAFIATDAWADERDADTVVELLAANLLHEMGHFLSLPHTSEADGVTFDLIADTPRCSSPEPLVCGAAGGAGNVMFHSGDAATLPYAFTPGQARVLRRHPLFRPAGGRRTGTR